MEWYKLLKVCREISKLTLRQVEEKTGVSNSYLSQIETGKIKNPNFFVVIKLLDGYNLTLNTFMDNIRDFETSETQNVKCNKCDDTGIISYYHDGGDHFGAGTAPGSEWIDKPCDCTKI